MVEGMKNIIYCWSIAASLIL